DGKPIGALPDGEMWFHHDTIHREIPHKATLLYAVEVPTYGGNTMFSNLCAAYDALPADLKNALDGRQALNAFSYGSQKKDDKNAVAARSQAIHPAVRTHEETGRKAIFVDRLMTQCLVDMPEHESDDILGRVFDHIEQPEFLYEHQWQKGDLVMWDNRSSIHARRDFPADQIRMMWRTTLAGDTPPR
ncbi:MAG TPA: TauD/TfdA family dioxygenase, partial [Afifellaceae bacterium]|nr:TauD/TfdA family dioxygenase [Afifellaceae bacterium]